MTPPASTRGDIEIRLERIAALIAGALRLVAENQPIDLAVLEFVIVDFRDAVFAAPAEILDGLAPRVAELQASLDGLAEALARQHGDVRDAIAVKRRAAFRAYGNGGEQE